MGQQNATFNRCIRENKRFIDCINLAVGEKVFEAEYLKDKDTCLLGKRLNGTGTYEKHRDVIKFYDSPMASAIIAIESQSEVNTAMVVRKMIYDAYEYDCQLAKLRNDHHKAKDLKGAQYIAGFSKKDYIIPVITICVYLGKEKWDAPIYLHDLINFSTYNKKQKTL